MMGLERLGLIKTSLLDYPGRVAAVIFTGGCNLRCPWCHNGRLVQRSLPEDFLGRADVLQFLRRRKAILGGVAITGGEPLYHQDLAILLEEISSVGLSLKLDTNGTYPKRLQALPRGLVDFIAMDIKNAPERYHLQGIPGMAGKIVETVDFIKETYPNRQFRTTWVSGLNSLEEIPQMAQLIGEGEPLLLTGFRSGSTLDPAWTNHPATTRAELEAVEKAFLEFGVDAKLNPL